MVSYTSTISDTLADGDTERYVVETAGDDAVRVDLSATGQPYDVDIQTAPVHPPQSAFNVGDYVSALPLGVETYTDTNEHTTATESVDASVFVAITNNSGSPITLDGSIDTHSQESRTTAQAFATRGTDERATAYRDGRALGNAESYNAGRVNNDIYTSEEGGLQAAINAASAGDRVIFDADETISTQVSAKTGVNIEGRDDATLTMADAANLPFMIGVAGVSDVHIDNVTFDGNRQNQTAGGRGVGSLSATGIQNVTVKDCTFRDMRLDCVDIKEDGANITENVRIIDNDFIDYGAHGAVMGSEVDASAVMRNCQVRGNYCHTPNSEPAGIALTFFETSGTCRGCAISDNTVETSSVNNHSAVVFEGGEEMVASGNVIDTTAAGLAATNGVTDAQFSGNVVNADTRCAQVAEPGSEASFDGGVYRSNAGSDVIRAEDSAQKIHASDIDIDILGSADYGVRVQNGVAADADVQLTGITVSGANLYGIWVRTAEGATISDCRISGCDRAGMRIEADDCTITGNRCYDNGSSGNTPYGIWLDSPVDCTVTGNRCYDINNNQTHGVDDVGDHNVIVGNALRGNTTGAVDSQGANSTVTANGT